MRIQHFKSKDIIQRTAPTEKINDHSYIGDRLEFLGLENQVIFFTPFRWAS